MFQPKKSFNWRRFWQYRYRLYALTMIFLISSIIWSTNANVKPNIDISERRLDSINIFAQKVGDLKYASTINQPKPVVEVDADNISLINQYKNQGYEVRLIYKVKNTPPIIDQEQIRQDELRRQRDLEDQKKKLSEKPYSQKTLDEIIAKPEAPQQINLLRYPKYDITTPIIYSKLEDIFQRNADGSINTSKAIEEVNPAGCPLCNPIQKLLVDGVVHMAYSPQPGELSDQLSSYIVGHSSNFPSVRSDYNFIFKPLESTSQVGEEFFIYDQSGRELKFRVFEVAKISEDDASEAYKGFPGRRVVTLQTSILGYKNGQLAATHRWLTRGELVK